jgi:hypothetical protein
MRPNFPLTGIEFAATYAKAHITRRGQIVAIDPRLALRAKKAWAALSANTRAAIQPQIDAAHIELLSMIHPAIPRPMVEGHRALLFVKSVVDEEHGFALDAAEAMLRDSFKDIIHRGKTPIVLPDGEIQATGKYQKGDPGWFECAVLWLELLAFGNMHKFVNRPATVPISSKIRIVITGDFGSGDWGTPSEPAPSTKIRNLIANSKPDITVHLGDVYYAGTDRAEKANLQTIWPVGSEGSFALNSNHEMYPGGFAYYDIALASTTFSLQNGCSYFVLENDNWVIIGLDSAFYAPKLKFYLEGNIDAIQQQFLRNEAAKDKHTVILTHHNGLNLDGTSSTLLWSSIISCLRQSSQKLFWYWGHEHAGVIYNDKECAAKCRCAGHGALPWGKASILAANPNVLWYEDRPAGDPFDTVRVLNGYVELLLDGPSLKETFYDENGGIAKTIVHA